MNFDYDKLTTSEVLGRAYAQYMIHEPAAKNWIEFDHATDAAENLRMFGQHYYDLGYKHGATAAEISAGGVVKTLGQWKSESDTEYEARLAFQRQATERLQAQVEAEHTKVVKARMLLDMLCKIIPGNLLDPYAQNIDHQGVQLQQVVALAKAYIEETK